MTYPIINDYRNAMRNASVRFATLKMKPIVDAKGDPVFMAGNFAVVFKVISGEQNELFALKCFIRDLPEVERRHLIIAKYIAQANVRYLVEIGFAANELFTTSKIAGDGDYPVVVMPWIEGNSFGSVIKKLCDKDHSKGLNALTRAWANLCRSMLSKGIAHGDLKHDNILVTPDGQLRLIDYDSIYTPQMKGMGSILLGGASYQHPRRDISHFNTTLDHFSMLVILLSLRVLAINPGLYAQFNTGENIIFSPGDFTSGGRSELINQIRQLPDGLVQNWLGALLKSSMSNSIAISGLVKILRTAKDVTELPKPSTGGFSLPNPLKQAFG